MIIDSELKSWVGEETEDMGGEEHWNNGGSY